MCFFWRGREGGNTLYHRVFGNSRIICSYWQWRPLLYNQRCIMITLEKLRKYSILCPFNLEFPQTIYTVVYQVEVPTYSWYDNYETPGSTFWKNILLYVTFPLTAHCIQIEIKRCPALGTNFEKFSFRSKRVEIFFLNKN